MTDINNIIAITISRAVVPVPQEAFGIMAVAAQFTTFGDRIRYYTGTAGMTTDGFAPTDPAYEKAVAIFAQPNPPVEIAVVRRDASDSTWAIALAAITAVDNTWYGIIACDNTDNGISQIAAWAESASPKRLYVAMSGAGAILDPASTTDIAYTLQHQAYTHTALIYTGAPATNHLDAAWMGQMLPQEPGSATWMFKTLVGGLPDDLNTTQYLAALAKNCNIYTVCGGINMTQNGTVAVGEYIDVIQGIDALQSDQQTKVFGPLVGKPKVSLTDPGIVEIEHAIQASLDDFTETDETPALLAKNPKPVITMPTRASLGKTNVQQRKLTGCKWSATLASAIHYVGITGTVTL